jgi:hypothetical protein
MTESVAGMRCYLHTERTTELTCAGCGSAICAQCCTPKARGPFCPQCLEDWDSPPVSPERSTLERPGRFQRLSVGAKFLTLSTIALSVAAMIPPTTAIACGIALIGLIGGFLLWQRAPAGWYLGMLWALCQVIVVRTNGEWLNAQGVSANVGITINRIGVSVNAIGVLLVIAFIMLRREFLESQIIKTGISEGRVA